MRIPGKLAVVLAGFGIGFGCQTARQAGDDAQVVLMEGLGDYHFRITTAEPLAQRYFNQGLLLAYGFNHDGAERSFLEATRVDPECAMCWWGAALVLGPHLNAGMRPDKNRPALARLRRAQELAPGTSPREQAYIQALSARYAEHPPPDRRVLDEAYAEALRTVARRFPKDYDAQTLLAEALMTLHPWDMYTPAGRPQPWTREIESLLEGVLRRQPQHPGANHFYIHAVEASPAPDRALLAAQRLESLVPAAGHLVHMPSHIYLRTGRYHAAMQANLRAIAADNQYLAQCRSGGLYALGYVPHNHLFLWAAAAMAGNSRTAVAAAREAASRVAPDAMRRPGLEGLQHFRVTPLLALVRFGRWDELLAEPVPAAELRYPAGIWHYARGMALIRKNRLHDAAEQLQALAHLARDPAMRTLSVWGRHRFDHLLNIAERALSGELALARGEHALAIVMLKEAVQLEDRLAYDEPAAWPLPMRQALGAAYLAAGQPAAAEAVYREDLDRNRDNGWSLYGLALALRAQERALEAVAVEQRLRLAWAHADVTLGASRF